MHHQNSNYITHTLILAIKKTVYKDNELEDNPLSGHLSQGLYYC
jgi:hypothetical protein